MFFKQRRLLYIAVFMVICSVHLISNQNKWLKYYIQEAQEDDDTLFKAMQQSVLSQSKTLSSAPPSRPELMFPYQINNAKGVTLDEDLPPEICFIKSSYAASTRDSDKVDNPVFDVREFQEQHPSFRFYMFTNLEELRAPGWAQIVTPNLPYQRFITQSRYGKFLAWLLPEIKECWVVFYLDAYVRQTQDTKTLRRLALEVLQSPFGLMQFKHPKSTKGPNPYGPIDELALILEKNKDIETNVEASIEWLEAQEDFNNKQTPVYANTYFGYNPRNPRFQMLALEFWDRYSLELDSWRDQPLWSYMIKKQNIEPTPFPKNHVEIFNVNRKYRSPGGHVYSDESNVTVTVSN